MSVLLTDYFNTDMKNEIHYQLAFLGMILCLI